MKRAVLFSLLLVFGVSSIIAQEVRLPYPGTTALVYEKNKVYYDGEQISKRDCQAYLRLFAQEDIYRQYRNGLRMYTAGWSLLGIGLAADVFAISFSASLMGSFTQDPDAPTMGPILPIMLIGVPVMAGGLAFTITSIPLICVGKKRMRQSLDAYNITLADPETTKNYWSIQPSANGIGLAYNF